MADERAAAPGGNFGNLPLPWRDYKGGFKEVRRE
jgi:hypothetical protein